jgi:hypothetical protein
MATPFGAEFDVYNAMIAFLQGRGAEIICASPPSGTDTRFKVCIFPKLGPQKGPRDELDASAATPTYLLLVEAKPALADSLSRLNRAGESDWDKLQRLMAIDEPYFLARMSQAYGRTLTGLRRLPCLAFNRYDAALPAGATGIHVVDPTDVSLVGVVPDDLWLA